ncbi:MAG: hypothetical protein CMQ32_05315 [Gammaproteobacteria bacterium]|nr:hypothetical protein [Gammaproteobacteria bacterium]HAC86446.1 hypothetical protein [Gammaproteobacteria bacterium]HAD70774.1 hypothetical protein [Gammaproteobacteria bacterium]
MLIGHEGSQFDFRSVFLTITIRSLYGIQNFISTGLFGGHFADKAQNTDTTITNRVIKRQRQQ